MLLLCSRRALSVTAFSLYAAREKGGRAAADGIINLDAHQPSHITHNTYFNIFSLYIYVFIFCFCFCSCPLHFTGLDRMKKKKKKKRDRKRNDGPGAYLSLSLSFTSARAHPHTLSRRNAAAHQSRRSHHIPFKNFVSLFLLLLFFSIFFFIPFI